MLDYQKLWNEKRQEPYTSEEIQKLKCIRCGRQAVFQWSICSDESNYRPICIECDIDLNRIVLFFMNHPDPTKLMNRYELTKRAEYESSTT